jgi:hypothetical protein
MNKDTLHFFFKYISPSKFIEAIKYLSELGASPCLSFSKEHRTTLIRL